MPEITLNAGGFILARSTSQALMAGEQTSALWNGLDYGSEEDATESFFDSVDRYRSEAGLG